MKLDKLLATMMVISSLILIPNSLWAADGETEAVNDAPPDELLPKDTDIPKYTGLPKIKFSVSKTEVLLVEVNGIQSDEVDGFMINDMDISQVLENGQKADTDPADKVELVKFTNFDQNDGFLVQINIPVQQLLEIFKAGQHKFCIKYGNGAYLLCGMVDFEALLKVVADSDADKGFGWTRVYGKVYQRGKKCILWWCWKVWKPVNGGLVYFYMYKGGWTYKGATRTNSSGYYNRYLQGNDASYLRIYARCPNGRRIHRTVRGPGCPNCPARVRANFYCR